MSHPRWTRPQTPRQWLVLLCGLSVLMGGAAGFLSTPSAWTSDAIVPVLVVLSVGGLYLVMAFIDEVRPGPHECPSCGYDLRGIKGDVCPECGSGLLP